MMAGRKNDLGAIGRILRQIAMLNANLEDMYSFLMVDREGDSDMILKVKDAVESLEELGNTIVASFGDRQAK